MSTRRKKPDGAYPPEADNQLQRAAAEYSTITTNYHEDLLHDLFQVVRSTDPDHAPALLEMIRNHASLEEVRAYLDRALTEARANASDRDTVDRLEGLRRGIEVESEPPRFRPQIMDIRYLCGSAPFRVPAKPWTSVTDDDDLVSHLVSLYLIWDYPFFAFFDNRTFIKHMAMGLVESDFCSAFLVNALLANACYYSQYTEAYTIPGDVRTKGADFLAEAERHLQSHQFEKGGDIRLASLQAHLLLYERYSLSGHDDWGYTMLHRAIEMAESLGIVNKPNLRLSASQMSEDMIVSIKRTAWGLFQVDTVVHTNFLRPSRVSSVSVERIDRNDTALSDMWTPYPVSNVSRPSYLSLYFDEACKLSFIARDISWNLSRTDTAGIDPDQRKQDLYDQLCEWEGNLPDTFDPTGQPAPHLLLLRMRYHTLVINICYDRYGVHPVLSESDERTPPHSKGFSAMDIAVSSARAIATLVQALRTEYGMEHAHQFAMYAINLALFTLIDQDSFDILDRDFLTLTSAMSIIACRSQLGRSVFHLFKLSVRSRNQGHRVQQSEAVPPGIKELFQQGSQSKTPDRWDRYAEDLTKADGESSYFDTIQDESQSSAIPGLHEMLEQYERLSVGKEEEWCDRKRREESAF
ncbi:pathway-specific regulatory protein [Aspergillus sclerotioniger CBS 115572]|uniref:Pathway-specific regulatory protein n=1 Tax=Aspergillus sclerotioniger CBS 115572 TaxID=1450535 RepID=A0A317V0P5_9EURO|nr:pathway-specific regulatory protein [Aspergillus sclerotioniger CBS 115572]PWY67625.1 pathway-specific regulatory protein [Aspergillus sclerotioniger CBS 115572]